MKGLTHRILAVCAALLYAAVAHAQFFLAGDDPAKIRWMKTCTPNYEIIYPRGMDSLARVYGTRMEQTRTAVGQSAGYLPGEFVKGRMPVILHGYHAVSNSSVAWAPKRFDLYLSPEAYDPSPFPWTSDIAIHEQRHSAQMQAGYTHVFRPFRWFFGEMANGLFCELYGGSMWLEGDAVVAETALSASGRGRVDSFLNWYMVSFDNGEWRDWYKWNNESQKYYTPNGYALGYMMISGMRYNHDVPDVNALRMDDCARHPWHWGPGWAIRNVTGLKKRPAFMESAQAHYSLWKEAADARAPYMESWQMTDRPSRYEVFSSPVYTSKGLYAIRSGLVHTPGIVRIDDDGKVHRVRQFSYTHSDLRVMEDGGKLIWSETVSDPRWTLRSKSVVRCYDIKTHRTRTITRGGQPYNPSLTDDGMVLLSEYGFDGSTGISTIYGSRKPLEFFKAPDGMQIVQTVTVGNDIYASAITDDGFGIYKLDGDRLACLVGPQPVTISDLSSRNGKIYFTSDRTGVEEYYCLDPEEGLSQLTSTRYGARDYTFSPDGNWLVYSASTKYGHVLEKTAVDSLPVKKVNFDDIYHWEIADTLSAQEKRYGVSTPDSISFTDPVRYRKFTHLVHFHSWAPVYFNYDNIRNASFDKVTDACAPGVTGVFQNDLGTLYGTVGYSYAPDTDGGKWRHSGHLDLTYTGLYPVLEAKFDLNSRRAHESGFKVLTEDRKSGKLYHTTTKLDGTPLASLNLSAYIPFKFNYGGLYRGFIPKLSYTISNDMNNTAPKWYLVEKGVDAEGNETVTQTYLKDGSGKRFCSQTIMATVRGYMVQATASSAVYPRWGFGAEAGYYQHICSDGITTTKGNLPLYSPLGYAYVYGYIPGFTPQQGLKITAKFGHEFDSNRMMGTCIVNNLPRGLSANSTALTSVCAGSHDSALLTADYAIPFTLGDFSVFGSFAFIKRMVLTPHFDCTFFWKSGTEKAGNLFSAGLDADLEFTSLCFMSLPVTVGLRADYNGGSSFESLVAGGTAMKHWFIGPTFSLDF